MSAHGTYQVEQLLVPRPTTRDTPLGADDVNGPQALDSVPASQTTGEAAFDPAERTVCNNMAATGRRSFLAFEGFDLDEPTYIVCAEIPRDLRPPYGLPESNDFLRLATFADVDAMVDLQIAYAIEKGRKLLPYTHETVPREALQSNLILVGGPAWNQLVERMLLAMDCPFIFKDGGPGSPDPIFDRITRREYAPEFAGGRIIRDVALLIRAPNPFDRNRVVLLCAGILTHGVEGAALALTDERVRTQNENWITTRIGSPPHFATLFSVEVVNTTNMPPLLARPGAVLAIAAWDEDHGFVNSI